MASAADGAPACATATARLSSTTAELTGSAVVELNRAVAVAQAGAPSAALAITDRPALGARRAAAEAGPRRRGGRRLSAGAGTDPRRARAAVPHPAACGAGRRGVA